METSEKIIIEELNRIIMMQAQAIFNRKCIGRALRISICKYLFFEILVLVFYSGAQNELVVFCPKFFDIFIREQSRVCNDDWFGKNKPDLKMLSRYRLRVSKGNVLYLIGLYIPKGLYKVICGFAEK